jgi:bifunctional DNA-binding transcriptional regulator/antitoxin component of YhaV-PrlF toxin-antitoxin module
MTVHYSLNVIKSIVEEIMPPRNNRYIDNFKIEFLISSKYWDYTEDQVEVINQRGFKYLVKKATLIQEIDFLKSKFDENFQYSDDHKHWMSQMSIKKRIKELEDEYTLWLLQELSKGSIQL